MAAPLTFAPAHGGLTTAEAIARLNRPGVHRSGPSRQTGGPSASATDSKTWMGACPAAGRSNCLGLRGSRRAAGEEAIMQKLSHILTSTHGLFGRTAIKASLDVGHNGPVDVPIWCRASILLLLRERELLE
jgi:hypothetical protein